MKIRSYQAKDKQALIRLWTECGLVNPKNDPEKDIERKLISDTGWLLIGEEESEVVASVMVGYEGHRGWLNYLAVAPRHRKKGYGRQIVAEAEARLKRIGCPKINLQVRKGNEEVLGFYRELGYLEDDVHSLGKRFIDDSTPGSAILPEKVS